MKPEQKNVLIVEDNDLTAEIIDRFVRDLGHDVVRARDGGRAIELLQATDFDAVFLDILMPHTDGFEVLNWLRRNEKKELPVIVFSEANLRFSIDFQQMAENLGALRAYDKPVTFDKVKAAFDEISSAQTDHPGQRDS
ncbi:MAG: response regulator [Rhodospirillales bacterium]